MYKLLENIQDMFAGWWTITNIRQQEQNPNHPEGTPRLKIFEQTSLLRMASNYKTAAWQNMQVPWHWYEEICHFGYTVLPNMVLQSLLSDATSISISSL